MARHSPPFTPGPVQRDADLTTDDVLTQERRDRELGPDLTPDEIRRGVGRRNLTMKEKRARDAFDATKVDAIGDLARCICSGGHVTEQLAKWAERYVLAFPVETVERTTGVLGDSSARYPVKEA